ncbi:hypothetical protein CUMW_155500 [Citrus unshiu]|nr:hypothetical protein CUMW_155500 [Citrus unshiu]
MFVSDNQIVGKDKGCNGDLIDNVFQFIQNNKVITTEINYPYKGVDRKCNAKEEANHAAKINGHKDVLANSETTLIKLQLMPRALISYYTTAVCLPKIVALNWTMLLLLYVDYGVADDGTKYWLVKIS